MEVLSIYIHMTARIDDSIKKIDKLNENRKKTNDLQIFPPIDVNGSSKINDDLKTRSCRDESQHWIYDKLKNENLKA